MNMNYLPSTLQPDLAPTDTRMRPDIRALENGDFKLAADVKHKLEEKQRAVKRYNDKFNITPKPAYFDEWKNPTTRTCCIIDTMDCTLRRTDLNAIGVAYLIYTVRTYHLWWQTTKFKPRKE